MSFWDKLKEITQPFDDDEFDEKFDEAYEEEPEEPAERPSRMRAAAESGRNEGASYQPASNPFAEFETDSYSDAPSSAEPSGRSRTGRSGDAVRRKNAASDIQVVMHKPERYEAAVEIADDLLEKRPVVVNLEGTDESVALRILAFLSGVAYAMNGKIKKIAKSTYMISPNNVDLTGDFADETDNNGLYF